MEDEGIRQLCLAVLGQGEADLRSVHERLVKHDLAAGRFLSGRADPQSPEDQTMAAKLTKLLDEHAELRAFYLGRGSFFSTACYAAGTDPEVKRRELREVLFLPWSGYLLRRALRRYEDACASA